MSTPDLERRAIALFEALLEVPESDREAWLDARTRDEPALAARVRAIMAADRLATLGTGAALLDFATTNRHRSGSVPIESPGASARAAWVRCIGANEAPEISPMSSRSRSSSRGCSATR